MNQEELSRESDVIYQKIAAIQHDDTKKIIKKLSEQITPVAIKGSKADDIQISTQFVKLTELTNLAQTDTWQIHSEINDLGEEKRGIYLSDKAYASFLFMKMNKNAISLAEELNVLLTINDESVGELSTTGTLKTMNEYITNNLNNSIVESFTTQKTDGALVLENFSVPYGMPVEKVSMYFNKILNDVCQIVPDSTQLMIPQRFFYLCEEKNEGDFSNTQVSAKEALAGAPMIELPEKYKSTKAANQYAEYDSPVESVVNHFVYERMLIGAWDSNGVQKKKIKNLSSEALCENNLIAQCLYVQLSVGEIKEKMKHKVLVSQKNKPFPSNVALVKELESVKPNQKEVYTDVLKKLMDNENQQEDLRVESYMKKVFKNR